MATKTIAWTTGSGNITLTYTGQGNGSISVASDENTSFDDRSQSFNIVTTNGSPEQAISVLVKQKGKTYPIGEVFNFSYTGSVQQITLPKGKYKLQCWGAQGGTSYGNSKGVGSKGGYSEGVLTLTKTTTLYIFVGGQGSRGSSTSLVNGGWNGGGASVGYSSYNSGDTEGYSYPACGGGATDISTVTSSMSYSSGRTNRSSASLLARCIVAGGGAGGSYRYKKVTTNSTTNKLVASGSGTLVSASGSSSWNCRYISSSFNLTAGDVVYLRYPTAPSSYVSRGLFDSKGNSIRQGTTSVTISTTGSYYLAWYGKDIVGESVSIELYKTESTSSTSTSGEYSTGGQYGGGTTGGGTQAGKQSSAGTGGGFGYGGSQTVTNYRYCSGGGGGGWYGGGITYSDTSISAVQYTGGGSGFVNTSANASSRPSGYTGLKLDSGTTKAGNSSFPSTNGGTETGHSGNGYARITVIE